MVISFPGVLCGCSTGETCSTKSAPTRANSPFYTVATRSQHLFQHLFQQPALGITQSEMETQFTLCHCLGWGSASFLSPPHPLHSRFPPGLHGNNPRLVPAQWPGAGINTHERLRRLHGEKMPGLWSGVSGRGKGIRLCPGHSRPAAAIRWDGWRYNITQARHCQKKPNPPWVLSRMKRRGWSIGFLGWKGHLQGKPCTALVVGLWGGGLHRDGGQIGDI